VDRKSEAVALLQEAQIASPESGLAGTTIPAWNQNEADRLLAHLSGELARIKREKYRGRFPPGMATIITDGLSIADRYVRNHEQEAARGWDVMELLRDLVSSLLSMARGDRRQGDSAVNDVAPLSLTV
jgi:hypothetical protein